MKHTYKKGLMEDYSIYRGSGWCATVCCINLLELTLPRSPQFLRHHCFEWEGKQGSQGVLQVNLHPGTVWQVQWRNSEVHQDPWQHKEKSPGRKYFKKSDKHAGETTSSTLELGSVVQDHTCNVHYYSQGDFSNEYFGLILSSATLYPFSLHVTTGHTKMVYDHLA